MKAGPEARAEALARTCAKRRRAVLRLANRDARVDAVFVTKRQDVGYLSGFGGEDGALLFGSGWAVLITDSRFVEQAPGECPGIEIADRAPSKLSVEKQAAATLKGRRVRRLGVQAGHVTLARHKALAAALGKKKIVPLTGVLLKLRRIKDAEEVRLVRKAVRIAERAFRELTARGTRYFVGRTERQLAAELEHRMRMAGADATAFDTIVAAGPNASICHYRPGNRKVRRGEAVLLDWGAVVDGYCSDITRVIFPGSVDPRIREIYGAVLDAHDAAVRAIGPGVQCGSVDRVARDIIAGAGYGPSFRHGLGHGLGREVHEQPTFAHNIKARLRAGTIMTVEPGIYLPGIGGVRIEDDILVTRAGCRRLCSLPRSIDSMILRR